MKDDLIRRKDAIDAIMGEYPEPHYPDWFADVVSRVQPAQAADCISRQAAIDKMLYSADIIALKEMSSAQPAYTDEEIQKIADLEQAEIEKAYQLGYEDGKKDVQPERKKGRWIRVKGRLGNEVKCSNCHDVFWIWMNHYRYCPNCGADMEDKE